MPVKAPTQVPFAVAVSTAASLLYGSATPKPAADGVRVHNYSSSGASVLLMLDDGSNSFAIEAETLAAGQSIDLTTRQTYKVKTASGTATISVYEFTLNRTLGES